MPFLVPWTDLPPGPRGRSTVQYQWGLWSALTPERWTLSFTVLADGEPVGLQAVGGTEFAVTREVHTGSWLGRRHQGSGIGTEMRAAVLHLAFTGLGADWAVSSALDGNDASIGVSRKLGYADDGIAVQAVRGRRRIDRRFRIDRPTWAARHTLPVEIVGLEPCRELLGAVSRDAVPVP
jgi:RimJ/RimL family protein N-acetyltransferase